MGQSVLVGQKAEIAGRIMVALDFPDAAAARPLLGALAGIPCYMKVGMELFYAAGPDFVRELKERGYSVFLDLKLHDIPNQVRGAAASITRLGVDMFNVHAAGGLAMMEAAKAGVEEGLQPTGAPDATRVLRRRPLLVAVTQLTSTSRQIMNEEIGIPGAVEDTVVRYAELAMRAGLDGAVASPREVRSIKERCGSSFLTVTPGIRPAGAERGDQARTMTPAEAWAAGTDYMVIGRPVTRAFDPRAALLDIIDSVAELGS